MLVRGSSTSSTPRAPKAAWTQYDPIVAQTTLGATRLNLDAGAVNSLIVNPPGGRVDGGGTYAQSEADWTFTTAP